MTDAPPFVAEWLLAEADGAYTESEIFVELFARLDVHNVGSVIDALPDPMRARFVAWARARYDNDVERSLYLFVRAARDDLPPDEAFSAIRRWFAEHRAR